MARVLDALVCCSTPSSHSWHRQVECILWGNVLFLHVTVQCNMHASLDVPYLPTYFQAAAKYESGSVQVLPNEGSPPEPGLASLPPRHRYGKTKTQKGGVDEEYVQAVQFTASGLLNPELAQPRPRSFRRLE